MIYFYVKVLSDITKMRFQVYILHLCFFILVVLTYLSQGQSYTTTTTTSTTEQPTFLQKIHETFKKVKENAKIHNLYIFDPPTWIYTTTTEKPVESTENFDITNRQLITVPVRCPPNYDFIKGRCREKIP